MGALEIGKDCSSGSEKKMKRGTAERAGSDSTNEEDF